MKKLILALTILPFSAFAGDEISDEKIKNKFLTLVKDAEVEKLITGTSEFQSCRDKNEFKASDNKNQRDDKLQAATACFKSKVVGKDAAALKKLAADLKLENYGLVKSNNVLAITEYLSKKMTKSLTGQDPDEKDPKKLIEQMKWQNQKIVDHKVFIDLYTNQLTKSALFEVSRFCFENLRVKDKSEANFAAHWTVFPEKNGKPDIDLINDIGVPSFLSDTLTEDDLADPAKLTSGLTSGGAPIKTETYAQYFNYCQKALPALCEDFKKNVQSQTQSGGKEITVNLENRKTTTKGANACLTIDKLKSIRLTMKNTEAVEKQFQGMGEDKDAFALKLITAPQLYTHGKGKDEESLDELTSYSSTDFMDQKKSKGDLDQMLKDCAENPSKECDEYLVKGDSLDTAINNVETTMNLKRELEVETVISLQKQPNDLKKYLEENGHFEILNELNENANYDVVDALKKVFEARKVAEIENLKFKVGKRQVSEKEHEVLRATAGSVELKTKIKENITDAKQERARMAQVMMFNNIITSSLDLESGTGVNKKKVGRNVSGVKKELADLEKSKTYNKELFTGVKAVADDSGNSLDNTSVIGGPVIDKILGKKDEP